MPVQSVNNIEKASGENWLDVCSDINLASALKVSISFLTKPTTGKKAIQKDPENNGLSIYDPLADIRDDPEHKNT